MRIRKNSRLVFNGGSSASSPSSTRSRSFLVCQLNRSPWDVESFSPQDYSFALNGSLGESHLASDSLVSGESMELSFEYVENPPVSKENSENGEDEITGLDEAITTPFCDRVDRSGWHCERLAKQGHTSCDYHHLSYHSAPPPPPPPPKKAVVVQPPPPPPPPAPKRRGRPRKVEAVVANNNPYEFYYYSGFGPRWAKKRSAEVNGGECSTKKSDAYENNGEEMQGVLSTTMSEYDIDIDIHNNNNNDDNDNMMKKMENGNGNYIENVIDEELDYIDDDDDDDDEEMYGRRRARKPIKARSLKSLM